MPTKEELENLVEKKVRPIVEKAMQDYLGITIAEIESDISDKLKRSPLIDFEIDTKISELLKDENKKKFDENHLLVLFKMYNYSPGIIYLCNKM